MSPKSEEADIDALAIGSALVRARSESGMTQAQLSEESGVSRSAIKGYETGRNMPGSRELKAICRVLRVSPNVLLFGEEAPFSHQQKSEGLEAFIRLLSSDTQERKKAQMRMAVLTDLLTVDEVASLMNLVRALVIARHGQELVEKHTYAADLMAALGLAMKDAFTQQIAAEVPLSTAQLQARMEKIVDEVMGKPNPGQGTAGEGPQKG